MELKLVTAADALAMMSGRQYAAGSFALYTAHTNKAKEMRQTKTFGCRHCQQVLFKPKNGDHVDRLFTFDGLVSHVKEKCVSSLFRP